MRSKGFPPAPRVDALNHASEFTSSAAGPPTLRIQLLMCASLASRRLPSLAVSSPCLRHTFFTMHLQPHSGPQPRPAATQRLGASSAFADADAGASAASAPLSSAAVTAN